MRVTMQVKFDHIEHDVLAQAVRNATMLDALPAGSVSGEELRASNALGRKGALLAAPVLSSARSALRTMLELIERQLAESPPVTQSDLAPGLVSCDPHVLAARTTATVRDVRELQRVETVTALAIVELALTSAYGEREVDSSATVAQIGDLRAHL